MQRWKVRLGPDRTPVAVTSPAFVAHDRYLAPRQVTPDFVYVSAVDEMGAFLEAIKWTEKHPL